MTQQAPKRIKCSRCGRKLSPQKFASDKSSRTGYYSACRGCEAEMRAARKAAKAAVK